MKTRGAREKGYETACAKINRGRDSLRWHSQLRAITKQINKTNFFLVLQTNKTTKNRSVSYFENVVIYILAITSI